MRILNYEFENHNGLQLIISANPMFEYSQLNQFELNMLKQNQMIHFLVCETEVIDNEYKFHYHIHNLKKLQHHMQIHCTTQKELYHFTIQLIDAIKASYTNMLTPDGCLIHMDTLFIDEKTNQILLAYLPLQYKEKMLFSFLQWLLYWSDHVRITDSFHLNRMFAYFIEQEFTLDRVHEALLDYLYQSHTNDFLYEPTLQSSPTTTNNLPTMPQQHQATVSASQLQPESIVNPITAIDNNDDIIEVGAQKPNLLRICLIITILICIPLAAWLKLYLPNPTITNLLLAVGISLFMLGIQVLFISHSIKKTKKERLVLEDSFFSEITDEHHPPYHFSFPKKDMQQQIDELNRVQANTVQQHSHSEKYVEMDSIAKPKGQLDTVQLGYENATVQLGQTSHQPSYLVRHYLGENKQYTLDETEIVVGRSIEGVTINDEYAGVSRLHIQFENKNGLIIAKDLGSRNGSMLNGKLMTPYKNCMINEHDKVQLVDKNGPIYTVNFK